MTRGLTEIRELLRGRSKVGYLTHVQISSVFSSNMLFLWWCNNVRCPLAKALSEKEEKLDSPFWIVSCIGAAWLPRPPHPVWWPAGSVSSLMGNVTGSQLMTDPHSHVWDILHHVADAMKIWTWKWHFSRHQMNLSSFSLFWYCLIAADNCFQDLFRDLQLWLQKMKPSESNIPLFNDNAGVTFLF